MTVGAVPVPKEQHMVIRRSRRKLDFSPEESEQDEEKENVIRRRETTTRKGKRPETEGHRYWNEEDVAELYGMMNSDSSPERYLGLGMRAYARRMEENSLTRPNDKCQKACTSEKSSGGYKTPSLAGGKIRRRNPAGIGEDESTYTPKRNHDRSHEKTNFVDLSDLADTGNSPPTYQGSSFQTYRFKVTHHSPLSRPGKDKHQHPPPHYRAATERAEESAQGGNAKENDSKETASGDTPEFEKVSMSRWVRERNEEFFKNLGASP